MSRTILSIILLFACSPTESMDVIGCMDEGACNYDSNANTSDLSMCSYEIDECDICGGNDINDEGQNCEDLRILQDIIDINQTLSGQTPSNIGHQEWNEFNARLDVLDLSNHELENIPSSIADLAQLTNLNLSRNNITTFPIGIASLSNLEKLYLYSNDINGEIPIDLSSLTNLTHLSLDGNEFSGEIPEEIYTLTNLEVLYLGRNNLEGIISSSIGNLVNLEELWLGDNNLYGNLPDELWDLTALRGLWIDNNTFTGVISEAIGGLMSLAELNIQNNLFSSTIPESICELENLLQNVGYSYVWEYPGDGLVWNYFDISNNQFCPEYPVCIEDHVGDQTCEE